MKCTAKSKCQIFEKVNCYDELENPIVDCEPGDEIEMLLPFWIEAKVKHVKTGKIGFMQLYELKEEVSEDDSICYK